MSDQEPMKLDEDDLAAVVGGSLSASDTKSVGTFHGDMGDMAKAFEAMTQLAGELRNNAREARTASLQQSVMGTGEAMQSRFNDALTSAGREMGGLSTGAVEAFMKLSDARAVGGMGSADRAALLEVIAKFVETPSASQFDRVQSATDKAMNPPLSLEDIAQQNDVKAKTEADFMQEMAAYIRDIQGKLQSIKESEADTMKSIMRA